MVEREIYFEGLAEDYPLIQRVIDAQLWRPLGACVISVYVDLICELYTCRTSLFKVNLRGKGIYVGLEVI